MNAQYTIRPADVDCNRRFVESLKGRAKAADDGENVYIPDFLFAAACVLGNYETFSVNDFYRLLANKDIPPLEIKRLFKLYTEKLVLFGRIKKIQGAAYDGDIYQVI